MFIGETSVPKAFEPLRICPERAREGNPAAHDSGWSDEQAYRSSKSISEDSAKRISERRRARAKAYLSHREEVRAWLAKHWGKVMDMRRAGLSWRSAAVMIADEYGIRISHTTLYTYWRHWYGQL